MLRLQLKRLLAKRHNGRSVRDLLTLTNERTTIVDNNHTVLVGTENGLESLSASPIVYDNTELGAVYSENQSELIAALLVQYIHNEAENNQLADEALVLYREINLLYNLSEKLSGTLDSSRIAHMILEESMRLIAATGGVILVQDEHPELFHPVVSLGSSWVQDQHFTVGQGLTGSLLGKHTGEIVNEVSHDERYIPHDGAYSSLIAAPLRTEHLNIGLIVLTSQEPQMYTSGDLKLLTALASQSASHLHSAFRHEQTLRELEERERRLKQRIEELSIELDAARQEKKVTEIVETEYFQQLRKQSNRLRDIIDGRKE